jgi:arylsulfatase
VRRCSLALTSAALLLGCSLGDPAPNLLLISVDTLRADRLVCYGGSAGAGLCGLFEEGTRYRWAFSSAASTSPSVATLLTSRNPAEHGVVQSMQSRLADDAVTVAEALRDSGYTTAAFVSNPLLARRRHFDRGFEVYDDHMTRRERNRRHLTERDAAATTDAALVWARLSAREPWFLWIHYQDPHGPYEPPGAAPGRDPTNASRLRVLEDPSGRGGIPDYQALPGLFTLPGYEARYRAEIGHLDGHLVRLVRALDAKGRPPVVLLTADHGEAFGEDGYYFAHGHSLGLEQIRVPLLVRGARPGPPRVIDEPVSGIDVAPTLLSLAGVASPASFRGRPLLGKRAAAATAEMRTLRAEHPHYTAEIRGSRYRSRARDAVESRLPDRDAVLGAHDALPAYHASPSRDAAPMATPTPFR